MKRRNFLKTSGLAGLGVGISGNILPLAAEWVTENKIDKPFFKLSLAQWSLHRAILETKVLSPMDFAPKAKILGFDAIEYVSQLYNEEIRQYGFDKTIATLLKKSSDSTVTNVLIMVDGEGELAALSAGERDSAVSSHHKWIDAAAELKCHAIRVNLFGVGAESSPEKWKETATEGLQRLTTYAAKNNVNVLVENHGGLSSNAKLLTEVIKDVNSAHCGTLPDFGNFCVAREGGERWGGNCIQEYDKYLGVSELMPFAMGVSAKSYGFDSKGNETTIDYSRMLNVVKKSGYRGYIGVEYEGSQLSEEDGIAATKKLLLSLSGQ